MPGGLTSKIPRGILAPSLVNFWGSRRNFTNLVKLLFSSSSPATSLEVYFFFRRSRAWHARLPSIEFAALAGGLIHHIDPKHYHQRR